MNTCPYCKAPQQGSAEDGRINCKACKRWYRTDQPALPDPPSQEQEPARFKVKGQRVEPIEQAALPPSPKRQASLSDVPYEPPTSLPDDLVALGFKLVHYAEKSAAVSSQWGCSESSAKLEEIVQSARNISGFIRWMKNKEIQRK